MGRASFAMLLVVMALASAAMSQEKKNTEERKNAGRAKDLPAVRQLMKNYWSSYATVATPKPGVDGKPIRDSGVTLLIVRRQEDGAWKVALMMATRGEHPEAVSQKKKSDSNVSE